MQDINFQDIFTVFGKFVENKFAFIMLTIFLAIDYLLDITYGMSILGLKIQWIKDNVDIGHIIFLIFIFIFFYQFVLLIVTNIYNRIIVFFEKRKLKKNFEKNKKDDNKKVDNKNKFFVDELEEYAIFTNNSLLLERVNQKNKIISNWFQERAVYLSFVIVGVIYLCNTTTTLKKIWDIFFGLSLISQAIYYVIFSFILLYILIKKTMKVPDRHLLIVSKKQTKEIHDYLRKID